MTKKRELKNSKQDTQTQESEMGSGDITPDTENQLGPINSKTNPPPKEKELYRVSQPAILFVTGEAVMPSEVVDAFHQMMRALEIIKHPSLNVVLVGDCATTLLVTPKE